MNLVHPRPFESVKELESDIAATRKLGNEQDDIEKKKAVLKGSIGRDTDAQKKRMELATARKQTLTLNILEKTHALQFFEYIELGQDEFPVIYIEDDEFVDVWRVSQLGNTPEKFFVNQDSANHFDMGFVESDRYFYPVKSATTGNLNLQGRLTKRAEHDIDIQINRWLWILLVNGIGPFIPGTTYHLDPWINATDYPATNYINMAAEGRFSPRCIKAIFAQCLKLGLKVVNIIGDTDFPPDFWDWVSVVTGFDVAAAPASVPAAIPMDPRNTVSPDTQGKIEQSGVLTQLFGYPFNIQSARNFPRGLLDAALGVNNGKYVFVSLTEPCGKFYTKPSDEKNYVWNEDICAALGRENQEGFKIRKNITELMPEPMRPNYICLRYR